MLKIYVCYGDNNSVVAVVSESEDNARSLMLGSYAYYAGSELQVLDISNGMYIVDQAD